MLAVYTRQGELGLIASENPGNMTNIGTSVRTIAIFVDLGIRYVRCLGSIDD